MSQAALEESRRGIKGSGPHVPGETQSPLCGGGSSAGVTKEVWRSMRTPQQRHPQCPDAIPIRQTHASSGEEGQCFCSTLAS